MTTTTTTITKDHGLIAREITVEHEGHGSYITMRSTGGNGDALCAALRGESRAKLAEALLPENATLITDLPKAVLKYGYVAAGSIDRHAEADPADVLNHAKELLAIHAFLVKHNEEQEAAKRAEEEAIKAAVEAEKQAVATRNKRRDDLARELSGSWGGYEGRTPTFKAAIDRIIELEEAAKVS